MLVSIKKEKLHNIGIPLSERILHYESRQTVEPVPPFLWIL